MTLALAVLLLVQPPAGAVGDRVDSLMRAELPRRLIPGAAVAVVRDGKVVKLGTYGLASLELQVPVSSQTRFQIASATKNFTSVAVHQLVREGKVALDDRLRAHLEWMPAAWDRVTIRQALSHTSGLPDLVVDPMVGTWLPGSWDSVVAQLAVMPVEPPDARWSYNQTNYALLGLLVRKHSGLEFTDYAAQRLFRPLGMAGATFGDSRNVLGHKTTEYSRLQVDKPPRRLEDLAVFHYRYPDFLWTAAGIFLDVEDMAKWLVALDDGRLLGRAALAEAGRPLQLADGKPFHFDGGPMSYNLGWVLLDRPAHRAMGGSGGGRSAYFYYPDDRLGVAVLTNLQGAGPEDLVERIAQLYLPDLDPISGG